eukprot:gb/GECH01005735.1/.p1 GENE.gb/GECH01005735.1/~~gb/GECH01005735.1/.p1  ORF type:complete len:297 (+),score=47.40 gb/GECH01005735.1/:1-891(+)
MIVIRRLFLGRSDFRFKSMNPQQQHQHQETSPEQSLFNQVISSSSPSYHRSFCSPDMLQRYLRANNGNEDQAADMLRDTLRWRDEEAVWHIREEMEHAYNRDEDEGAGIGIGIARVHGLGTVYRHGWDRERRPVVYMRPGAQNPYPAEDRIRYMVWLMEDAIHEMEGPYLSEFPCHDKNMVEPNTPDNNNGTNHLSTEPAPPPLPHHSVDKLTVVLDFIDFGNRVSDHDSKTTARRTISILQSHYPERLGLFLLLNPPWYFSVLYWVRSGDRVSIYSLFVFLILLIVGSCILISRT